MSQQMNEATERQLRYNHLAGKVIVALDYPTAAAAERLLQELSGIPCYLKVGMELFYAAGPGFLQSIKERGYKVFLDLKMHDIPNTVKGGAASVTRHGVDMFNVHAAGGRAMMEAALEGVDQALAAGTPASLRPLVIAVTHLTSTSQLVMNEQIGIAGTVEDAVVRYTLQAQQAGMDGVVASSREVRQIKTATSASFVTVTPGIRPGWATRNDDQARVMTPREALAEGTDYMVVGRPITTHANPREALHNLIEELMDHAYDEIV